MVVVMHKKCTKASVVECYIIDVRFETIRWMLSIHDTLYLSFKDHLSAMLIDWGCVSFIFCTSLVHVIDPISRK